VEPRNAQVGALALLAPRLEAAGTPLAQLADGLGRSVLGVGASSKSPASIAWAAAYGTYLGRYRLEPGPAVHVSATCLVRPAQNAPHSFM
jgi:hypothetical protein